MDATDTVEHGRTADDFGQIEEVIYLLDAARSQEGMNPLARLEAIQSMEQRAAAATESLTRVYVDEGARLSQMEERRIWDTVTEYWRHVGAAYEDCFWQFHAGERGAETLRSHIPVIVCRAMRALSAELKWLMMAYAPADPTLWGRMGALYGIAEMNGTVEESCLLRDDCDSDTSIRQEYLRALMFAMTGVDSLTPLRIELADRLTSCFATAFMMQSQPGKGCHYYIDLSAARAPARLVDRAQSPAPNPRFYGPGKAGAQAEKLIEMVTARGTVPPELGLPADFSNDCVTEVLRHLARQWAALPPARGGERQASTARLHLVHGFDVVLSVASGLGRGAAVAAQTETWNVRDVSDGGFGALVIETPQDWLRVGTLIATRLESTVSWGIGVIRRLGNTPQQQRLVGIKMLSNGATPVQLLPPDGESDDEGEVALLLPSSKADSAGKDEVQLLLRAGSFYSHRPLHMVMYQRAYPLMPKLLVEAGRDFELWRFRVATR